MTALLLGVGSAAATGAGAPAAAQVAPDPLPQGRLMPSPAVEIDSAEITSVSMGGAVHRGRLQFNEDAINVAEITSFGSGASREIPRDATTMSGRHWLTPTREIRLIDPHPRPGPWSVEVRDLTSGVLIERVSPEPGWGVVAAYDEFMVVRGRDAAGDPLSARIQWYDGTIIDAHPDVAMIASEDWVGHAWGEATALQPARVLDPSTGTLHLVDTGVADGDATQVDRDHLLVLRPRDLAGPFREITVWTVSRESGQVLGEYVVDVGDLAHLRLVGGQVAILDQTATFRYDLLLLSESGGARTTVVGNVTTAKPMGDGRLLVHAAAASPDDGSDFLIISGNGAVESALALPPVPQSWTTISLVSGELIARNAREPGNVWRAPATGTGAWTPAPDLGRLEADGTSLAEGPVRYADDRDYIVSWPGGSRAFSANSAHLTRGGQYLVVGDTSGRHSVVTARGGIEVVPPTDGPMPVVDQHLLWTVRHLPEAGLVARDLRTTQQWSQPLAGCDEPVVRAAWSRWVALRCTGEFDLQLVRDVADRGADTWLPPAWRLGPGYVWRLGVGPDVPPRGAPPLLQIRSLVGPAEERAYGPLRGRTSLPGASVSPDSSGGASLAYLDPTGQARVIDLGWIPAPGSGVDRSPPILTSPPRLPTWITATRATDVPVRWAYDDPVEMPYGVASGVSAYDVRVAPSPDGPWQSRHQGLSAHQTTIRVSPSERACVSVRSRDHAGNTSEWTPAECTTVDGSAPRITSLDGPPAIDAGYGTRRFSWSAMDDIAVESYDIEQRLRPHGKKWQGWRRALTGSTTTSLQWPVAHGADACVRVRARDGAGRLSAWRQRCFAAMVPAVSARRGGAADVVLPKGAAVGSSVRLGSGGFVSLARQRGSRVVVRVLRSPSSGTLDVFVGKHRIGVVRAKGRRGWATVSVRTSRLRSGTLTLRSTTNRTVIVDAVLMRP